LPPNTFWWQISSGKKSLPHEVTSLPVANPVANLRIHTFLQSLIPNFPLANPLENPLANPLANSYAYSLMRKLKHKLKLKPRVDFAEKTQFYSPRSNKTKFFCLLERIKPLNFQK
jgi:hypothetical protein